MKKKLLILFSLFALCFGISLPLILSNKKVSSVSAEDVSLNDTILYDYATEFNGSYFVPNKVYKFTFNSVVSGVSVSPIYFMYGDAVISKPITFYFQTSANGRALCLKFSLLSNSTGAYYEWNIPSGLTPTYPVSVYMVFSANTLIGNLSSYVDFTSRQRVYKNTATYYEQLFSQIEDLEDEISVLNTQINNLQLTNSSLTSQLSTLQTNYNLASSQLSSITTLYNTLLSTYNNLAEDLEDRLEEIRDFIPRYIEDYEDYFTSEAPNVESLINFDLASSYLERVILNLNNDISNYLNTIEELEEEISFNNNTISNLEDNISILNQRLEVKEEEITTLQATSNVFGLIKSAFSGVVPLFDFELAPNITIGMILTIPFVIAILSFAIKLIG